MATERLIHEDELDELLTLYQMLNPADPKLEKDEELRRQWREMVHDEWLKAVVVEHDGRLVSSCVLSITPNLTILTDTNTGKDLAVQSNQARREQRREARRVPRRAGYRDAG